MGDKDEKKAIEITSNETIDSNMKVENLIRMLSKQHVPKGKEREEGRKKRYTNTNNNNAIMHK